MSISFGNTLKELRKKQKVSQRQLSRGLCSIANLSKIELGEREPGQMLFESMISRLGKDCKKWELILSEQEKQLIKKINDMEYLVETKQWNELRRKLEQAVEVHGVSQKLYEQYQCLLYAILYREQKEYKRAIQYSIEGLEKTEFSIKENRLKINTIVSKNELRILCLIGKILLESNKEVRTYFETLIDPQNVEEVDILYYWKSLLDYINKHCTDPWYRLEFYLETLYYLAFIAYEEERYKDCIAYCKQGIQQLIERKSTCYLKKFLLLLKALREKQSLAELEKMILFDHLDLFLEIIEERKKIYKEIQEVQQYIRSYNSIYSINQVIKNMRHYCGKTQEEMMQTQDGRYVFGNQSGISKMENGKRTPRRSSGQRYLKNLGLSGKEEYYRLAILGEDFEIQELVWELDFYIANHEREKAKELYELLKEKVECNNPYNEQYMKATKLIIYHVDSPMSCEQSIKELYDILGITIKDVERLKNEEERDVYFFTREEIILIMNIGCAYHKKRDYEMAKKYYQKVERYFRDCYQVSNGGVYRSVSYNLSQVYGLLGDYWKSIEKSNACLFMELLQKRANGWCRILFNIGWCYGNMMQQEIDMQKKAQYQIYYEKFFKQSFCVVQFYKDETVINTIIRKRKLWNIKE